MSSSYADSSPGGDQGYMGFCPQKGRCDCYSAVLTQQRSTSATLQAWATQPRGVKGGSASKISLMEPTAPDRKSTRLNSSHVEISYAVFCLKKKNKASSDA